jgi:hypothetical protein
VRAYAVPMVGKKDPGGEVKRVLCSRSVERSRQQGEIRLVNFSLRLSRRTTIKNYRSERKERRSFDTAIGYDTAAMGLRKGADRKPGGPRYSLRHNLDKYGRLNDFLDQKYVESFGYPALHLNFLAGAPFPADQIPGRRSRAIRSRPLPRARFDSVEKEESM